MAACICGITKNCPATTSGAKSRLPKKLQRISPAGLSFFDVNTNRVLEHAGLQIGQRLARESSFRSLDQNRDQRLTLEELRAAQIPQEGSSNFADNALP